MNESFLQNFLSNLFATFIALIIGIPIALWLERMRVRREEKAREREEQQRTRKILQLLKTELHQNKEAIDKIHIDVANYYYGLRTELWDAFSDGGELQWIKDPDLLAVLSAAFSGIRQVRILYEKYTDLYFYPGTKGPHDYKQRLFDRVLEWKKDTDKKIDLALSKVDEKLNGTSLSQR